MVFILDNIVIRIARKKKKWLLCIEQNIQNVHRNDFFNNQDIEQITT